MRQVEGKGYESGKGKGGQGVVCYNCGTLLSAGRHQVEKEKEKVEKEKCGMFRKLEKKTGALIHKQAHQRSRKQEQHQQQKEMSKFDDWLPRLCLSLKKLMMKTM